MTALAAAIARHPRMRRGDPALVSVLVVTGAGLIGAVLLSSANDLIFAFSDAPSHVVTPRRIVDNADPTLSQLGVHWPPLYHVLQMPFVWIDELYRSGASGVVVSVAASLFAAAYLYRLALLLGGSRAVAVVAALLLVTSPNFLYTGVVPMLPATMMATTIANVYYLTRWAIHGDGWSLLLSGVALSAATLTHIETWILAPLELGVVLITARSRWRSRSRTEATVVLWALAGGYGLAMFLLMNVIIFGDPTAFTHGFEQTGDVGAVARGGADALLAYPLAAWHNAGPLLAVAGLCGAALFAWRARSRPQHLIALLLFYPAATFSLQAATVGTLIVPEPELGDWRNLRYGVTLLPALALFAALGLTRRTLSNVVLAGLAIAASVAMVTSGRVAAWEDARNDVPSRTELKRSARWVGERSGDARILVPVHHEMVDRFELMSGRHASAFIDANDTEDLERALEKPRGLAASEVEWIVWLGDRNAHVVTALTSATGARLCHERRSVADSTRPLVRIYAVGRPCADPTPPA